MHAAPDGAIVVGTSRGGVSVKRGDAWRNWSMADGLAQDEIMDALYDHAGACGWRPRTPASAWSRPRARSWTTTRNGLPSNVVYSLFEDRDGSMWVATAAGVVHFAGSRIERFGVESGLPDAPAFHFLQDANGVVYVGTERGAYRRQGMRFAPVSPLLPQDGVPSLARDASGNLWVGTINNGLLRLSARTGASIASAASAACPTTASPRSWSIAKGASGPEPTAACCA